MATIKQYAINLWKVHRTVCTKLGMDVSWGESSERVRVISNDIMMAGLVKVLTDKGVITDAELNAVYTTIRNASFPSLPPVERPDLDHGEEAPDPDLGS